MKTRGTEIEKTMRRVIRKVSEGGMKMRCMLLSQKIEKKIIKRIEYKLSENCLISN